MGNVHYLDRDIIVGPVLFRAVNDIVRDLDGDRVMGLHDFVCECGDETCTRVLRMTSAEYDALRGQEDCFAVLAGHERGDDADVVGRTDSYVIVHRRPPAAPAPPPPSRKAA